MPAERESPRRLAYYFALSQVGFEMVAPIGLGCLIDQWLTVFPWATVIGAVIGLIGGLVHLVAMSKNEPKDDPAEHVDE